MSHLKINRPGGKVQKVELGRDEFRIGRNEDNDLVLPDQTVSRFHACIRMFKKQEFFEIENLSKTNPVYHNGRELQRPSILFDNDLIEIGVYQLKFSEV